MTKQAVRQHAGEIQALGRIAKLPIVLDEKTCMASLELLNQILADTLTLRDLYKKHYWQAAGGRVNQLHLLFDKHFHEQSDLADAIAGRIRLLGGVSIAMAADVAETTMIPRPPRGREETPVQVSRLLEAHGLVLKEARRAARLTAETGDHGTNERLVSDVIRTNELQVWFIEEHLADGPLVRAGEAQVAAK